MINVLIINSTLERSGITNVIFNHCKFLDKNKVNITIITLSKEPINSRKKEFEMLGVKVICLNKSRFLGMIGYKKELQVFVAQNPQEIIHTFSYRGTYLASKYLRLNNRVVTLESNLEDNYVDTYGNIIGKYIANKELSGFKAATLKVTCSQTLFKTYQNFNPDIVIQNGADDTVFYNVSNNEKLVLRKQLGLPIDKSIYISVGGLIPRKDPKTIIDAFIKANINNAVLLFLGDGPLHIDKTSSSNIIFKGNVPNVNEYLKCADVFVSASISEGLPNTVLEAALCGLTIIVSDIPQHHDVFVSSKEEAVYYFPIKDVDKLMLLFNKVKHNQTKHTCQTAKAMASMYFDSYQKMLTSQ